MIDLTNEEIIEILELNVSLKTLRNLIRSFNENTLDSLFNRVLKQLKVSQASYDEWFIKIKEKYKIEQSNLEIDFKNQKLLIK